MTNAKILLTNDDGPNSPLLEPFIRCLLEFHNDELFFAIPSEEKSWISQALFLRKNIQVNPAEIADTDGYFIDATPAQCVSIASFNLAENRPRLCVSGINLGINAGLPLYYTSGTVGAARQAALSGIPAIAISVFLPQEIFSKWHLKDERFTAELLNDWTRIAKIGARLVQLISTYLKDSSIQLININLPWNCSDKSEIRVTRLERIEFGKLHALQADGSYILEPKISNFNIEANDRDLKQVQIISDIEALKDDYISLTPISLDNSEIDLQNWIKLEGTIKLD